MGGLPTHSPNGSLTPIPIAKQKSPRTQRRQLCFLLVLSALALIYLPANWTLYSHPSTSRVVPINAGEILSRCASFKVSPGPPADFGSRTKSDRFQEGTRPTLLKNTTLWSGDIGSAVVNADVLLDQGLIKWIGGIPLSKVQKIYAQDIDIVDARGAWLTPGIVDMHSHLGVEASPALEGASDGNSLLGITQPWLRSLDGLNTHDDAFALSISGGVTSVNVLPGSANAIGGQAFPIKLRKTTERSPSSMLVEQPGSPTTTGWRQMKHACGENPSRVYNGARLDTIWAFRSAYNEARSLKERQDKFCTAAEAGEWDGLGEFPEDLKWEALADVLRGKVKIHNHCYEAVDLDALVRLTNEFKFPIAAFHHAHEAYLVPDLIKKAWGTTPAVAMFATSARYKREAYRGSEFAPRILADNGLRVVMKSDHPVLDSRFLLYEAQQAHFYGLAAETALASVTSTPATVLGLDHRIGYVKQGYDADVVLWDSHPLALGATPEQVYIDGIAQLASPHVHEKPASFQETPKTPNFDQEAADAVKYEGLPPLTPEKSASNVVFTNVKSVWSRVVGGSTIEQTLDATLLPKTAIDGYVVVVEGGKIKCTGTKLTCGAQSLVGYETVNLEGGSLAPGLISFGAPLGLEEIMGEKSTNDGSVYSHMTNSVPAIVGGDGAVIRAVDGLAFATRDALLAYRSGVTTAVSAPVHSGVFSGLGTQFSVGTANKLQQGSIVKNVTALHVTVKHFSSSTPSISTQIAALRKQLLGGGEGDQKYWFGEVAKGSIPLVVNVDSADAIATLVNLKHEVEANTGNTIRLTLAGATEAHLVARELGEAGVGVVLIPSRPFPNNWERRRILAGPPISEHSAISVLLAHNVTVGIGVTESWSARNTRFDVAWAALDTPDVISKEQALALATTGLETLLGATGDSADADIVAYRGGDALELSSKVVGIISPRRNIVELV